MAWLDLGAEEIVVKNNLVALYPARAEVVKLFEDASALRRHVQASTLAQAVFSTLRVPRLIDEGDVAGPHVVEEYVAGKRPGPEVMTAEAVDDLVSLHMAGDRLHRTPLRLDADELTGIRRLFDADGVALPVSGHHLRHGLDLELLCGSIHGDLSLGNMLLNGDGCFVLDWEQSRSGPVALDLLKIARSDPGFIGRYEQRLRHRATASTLARTAFPDQVAACLLRNLSSGRTNLEYYDRIGEGRVGFKAALERIAHAVAASTFSDSRHHEGSGGKTFGA